MVKIYDQDNGFLAAAIVAIIAKTHAATLSAAESIPRFLVDPDRVNELVSRRGGGRDEGPEPVTFWGANLLVILKSISINNRPTQLSCLARGDSLSSSSLTLEVGDGVTCRR